VDLRSIVICKICQTPHKKRPLGANESAHCSVCGSFLYREWRGLEYRVALFSFVALVMLLLSLWFPLVRIDMGVAASSASILDAIRILFGQGYFVVAAFATLVLVVYPLFLLVSALMYGVMVAMGDDGGAKFFLLLFTHAAPWSMLDIFFVSVLVAMVKIFEYATVEFGAAFWMVAMVAAMEIYLVRVVGTEAMWEYWEELFGADSL